MDDPIFDPWSISEAGREATPTERTPRWRSAARAERVATNRPAPPRLTGVQGHALSGDVGPLRALLMPRLMRVVHRLEMAGHRTKVDDRLDQPKPSLRLRMRPWQAPLADRTEGAGAVLEILLDEGPAPTVTGQFWIDSPSAAPTHLARIDATRLTSAWVDRLLLDFVERALRGG